MTCHHHIATTDAKLGLPEVTLGLLPGAGGTVGLPPLVAAETKLNMIAIGKSIGAAAALDAGLVDAIARTDLQLKARQQGTSLMIWAHVHVAEAVSLYMNITACSIWRWTGRRFTSFSSVSRASRMPDHVGPIRQFGSSPGASRLKFRYRKESVTLTG